MARLVTYSQPRDHYYGGRADPEINTKTTRRHRNGRPTTRSCPRICNVSPVMVVGTTPEMAAPGGNTEVGIGGIPLEAEGLSRWVP